MEKNIALKKVKEKIKKLDLDPFGHPIISGTSLGLGMMVYNHKEFVDQIIESPTINTDSINHLLFFGVYAFLGYNFFRTLNKFKGPNRFKSYYNFFKLNNSVYGKDDSDTNYTELEEKIANCFEPGSSYKYLTLSGIHFNHNRNLEGIENLLKYCRSFKCSTRIFQRTPITDISSYIMYSANTLKTVFNEKFKKNSNSKLGRYESLGHALNFGNSNFLAKHAVAKIEKAHDEIQDKVAYGAVMDYIIGIKDENWSPFLTKLSQIDSVLENENIGMNSETITECRNKVFRYPGIYLKRYISEESLIREMNNLKVVFRDLNHVLSHGISAEIAGAHYFIAPECEETLYDALPGMDLNTKESFILQALQNLADIEVTAEYKGKFSRPDKNHYTSRLLDLAGFLELDDEFKEMWHNYISKKLIAMSHLYYKDSNPRNYIKEDNLLFEIDFEGNLKKPFGLDLVNVLEFSRIGLEDTAFDYIEKHIANLKSKKIPVSLSIEDYEICRAQRHIELLGYRYRDYSATGSSEMHQYMHEYSANALDALAKLSYAGNGSEYTKLARKLNQSLEDFL